MFGKNLKEWKKLIYNNKIGKEWKKLIHNTEIELFIHFTVSFILLQLIQIIPFDYMYPTFLFLFTKFLFNAKMAVLEINFRKALSFFSSFY